jgi:hypothetical protein
MTVTDEEVMAYVDGELDAPRREAIDRELPGNPELQERVAAEKTLRDRFRNAFDRVLDEPVPQRLLDSTMRASPVAALTARSRIRQRGPLLWASGLAAAAGVVLGVALSPWILRSANRSAEFVTVGSTMEAGGALATALSQRLGSEPALSDGIRMGVSFVAKTGGYCRTFVLEHDTRAVSGLACRQHGAWQVQALESTQPQATGGSYRQAASALSPLIARAVQESIIGDTLDADEEARAREHSWAVVSRK